ncbi:RDD family protein [Mariniblastus fucicola]|uniref:RDD family protein n=1 Tax=Mariniblastus fucicola TaxID=980251 RepID=A0A5B9PGE0_9BACT|nr:RDD family protein [Mariniblastus fucicola]QEG21823.1 RDD family protein [Mariniblastus fucicola]
MSELNPYAPAPVDQTKTPLAVSELPLATLWQRFAGNFIDSILLLLVMMVPYFVLIMVYGILVDPSYFETASLEPRHLQDFVAETVLMLISLTAAFFLLNGYLLAKQGQTIGKLAMKTRILGDDNQLVPLGRLFLMRYLWLWLITIIPVIGGLIGLVNAVSIFGADRKCLHDKVASTKVISLRG